MNFDAIKSLLYYYVCTASGALATLAAVSIPISWYTGEVLYFWISATGYLVYQARLENPTVIVLSEGQIKEEE